nr:uncharacterized protein LOC106679441 isoform X2 [Halyomorpha halys]
MISLLRMLAAAVLFSCLLSTGYTHISLTFPPARKYDLDFLGNFNTKGPCGMPKGSTKTTLLAGKPFNITWHIAYPQKGGFRLQLLDKLERPVLDLTPVTSKSEYVTTDPISQHYTVSIPSDYECEDCTIRLLKEANKKSSNNLFWSCADVDIKTRKTYKEDCSGHGPYLLSKCRCNRLYYGPRCQYRDECADHTDCGDRGRCVDIQSTTAPRKYCYCEFGWFDTACKKRSTIRNDLDFSNYMHRELSPTFQLYWRILTEEQEIEIALVANSTSYLGIGWRPSNTTLTCKNFPLINYTKEEIIEPKNEPDAKLETQTSQLEQNLQQTSNSSKVSEPQAESEPSSTISSTFQTGLRRPFRPHRTVSSRATKDQDIPDSDFQPEISSVTSVSYRVTSVQGPPRGKRETRAAEGSSKEENHRTSLPNSAQDSERKTVRDSKVEPENLPKSVSDVKPITESSLSSTVEMNVEQELRDGPSIESESKTEQKLEFNPNSKADTSIQENDKEKDIFSKYATQNGFSPMDCTDMVIGTARGNAFRIWDYYTRDMSTPKLDTYWGGKNDLTAAMGFEKDGVTTIVFRKKLKATEMTDHSIENSLMHVIWAKGQDNHDPKLSGSDQADTPMKEFYNEDELKYHGLGGQRGVASINFFEQAEVSSANQGETTTTLSFCQGEWSYPKNCDLKKRECEYHATWHYISSKGHIQFSISTTNTQLWTGIAFSKDHKMAQTDAIIGWVDKSGRPFMMDTWIVGQTAPFLDESQDIFNITGKINDGVTTLTFLRKRDTGDTKKDFAFTDNNCLYMMFPVKGGDYNPVNKKIRKHKTVPSFSSTKVCIKSCAEGEEPTTPPPPPHVNYNIEIKLVNLGENYKAPRPNTDDFDILSNTISSGLKNKISGFRNLKIIEFKQEKDNIIAEMDLEVDQEQTERGRSLEESDTKVKEVMQSVVSSGKVGSLTLDPSYFIFQPVQTSWVVNNEDMQKTTLLSVTKLWVVIGCIIALLIVAVMQAGCTIYKTMNSTGSKHKDALTFNSAWKDYSTANTNYAFEPFESDEKQPHSLGQSNGSSRSTMPLHKPISAHPMVAYHANGSQYADTRSLQRPKGYQHSIERSTYSLPRTQPQPPPPQGYYTHRSARNNGDQLQPDFYFMPSQRKYSGMLQT